MDHDDLPQRVEAVRHFSRFYTRQIGLLNRGLLSSPFSLSEARVIYELAQHEQIIAMDLARDLGLDPGYMSRMLKRFKTRGLIATQPSETDGRQTVLRLTAQGQDAFALLDARSKDQIEAMLGGLQTAEQERLIHAMRHIQEILGDGPADKVAYLLRPHQSGDMGWVVHRHGLLYAQEYGWDERFEALVATIVAEFIQNFDPSLERCWIAEKDGENVGSVFLVKQSDQVAKLRLLLVEPKARGLGMGKRLVDECVRFARQAGYAKMTLWTNSLLLAARHLYVEAGFRLVHEEQHHSFGHDLVGETWELNL